MNQSIVASAPWLLDVLIGAILLACACVKGAKGIYKSLMPLVVTIAAVICATFTSALLTEPVTEVVYPTVEDVVIPAIQLDKLPEDVLENFAYLVTEKEQLTQLADEFVSEDVQNTLARLGLDLKDFLIQAWEKAEVSERIQDYLSEEQIEKLKEIGVELKTAADTALDATQSALDSEAVFFSAIFSLTYRLTSIAVHFFLWCIFCVLFLVVFTIIKNALGLTFKLPVIGWVDKLGGAILGAVLCGIVLYALGWILNLIGFTALHDLGAGTKLFSLFF